MQAGLMSGRSPTTGQSEQKPIIPPLDNDDPTWHVSPTRIPAHMRRNSTFIRARELSKRADEIESGMFDGISPPATGVQGLATGAEWAACNSAII